MSVSNIMSAEMASPGSSWHLPIIFESITVICFVYICKFPVLGKWTDQITDLGFPVTRTLLVVFAILCPFVHRFLLPVHLVSAAIEGWLQNTDADAPFPHDLLVPDMMYNAATTCGVAFCVFGAYAALLRQYERCAQAVGQALIRQEKDRENHVGFAEPEVCAKLGVDGGIKQYIGSFFVIFAACVAFLPLQMQNAFAYILVQREWVWITLDHVLISASIFFAAIMACRVWHSFNHFPAGYCQGLYVAGQFTIGYGSLICVSLAAFLAFAAEVMITYTYKLMRLHQMRVTQPFAQAENVMLPTSGTSLSERFAEYLADCTFATVVPGTSNDVVMTTLRLLEVYYRAMFMDCVEILLFGCLVFAPMAMVILVSLHSR